MRGRLAPFAFGLSLALAAGCTKGLLLGPSGESPASPGSDAGPRPGPGTDPGPTPGPDPDPNPNPGPTPAPPVAALSAPRRLSQAELDNTVRDLLGLPPGLATQILPEDEFTPYDNDVTSQQASEALVNALEVYAEEVSRRLLLDPEARDRVVGCVPEGPGDAVCFRTFVESFGRLALRRPLEEEEVTAYLALQAFATEDNAYVENDFYTAVALVIRALLQDPEFLYRIERSSSLSGHEIAARLSYLLWGSTPDDELLRAAESGALLLAEGRRTEAERLLRSPKAKEQLQRFHAQWLGYRAIPHPPALAQSFSRETGALIDRVIFDEPRSYLDLFRLEETYVDPGLAAHYGLASSPQGGASWVSYAGTERAGILSHGSVLAAFSKFSDTSPTQRGILVRTRLMCQRIESPPADVDVDQPPGGADNPACKSERYAMHQDTSTSCYNCHSLMDPIGFGLERYDIGGRYRTHDDGAPNCTIDGQGALPGYGSFSGPRELASRLIESRLLDACVVRQLYTFAIGYPPQAADAATINHLTARFREGGHRLKDLLLDYVSSPEFATRREGAL